LDDLFPYRIAFCVNVEPVGFQEFPFWISSVVGHPCIDIYKMEVIGLPVYFCFDYLVGITDAVDDVPAGDAGFDGNEGEGDVAELLAGTAYQLLEEDEYFFRMTAVSKVVVSGINDDGIGVEGRYQAVEKPVASGECRAAEAQVGGMVSGEVCVEGFPEPDGGTAIKEQFRIIGECCSFFFQSLDLIFVPDHMGVLLNQI
jgi:hypothetical protein